MVPSQLAWNAHNCVGKFYYRHYLIVTVHQCPRATFRTRSPCVKCNMTQSTVLHRASCRQMPGPHAVLQEITVTSLQSTAILWVPWKDHHVRSMRSCSDGAAASPVLWQSVPGTNPNCDILDIPFACHPHAVSQAVWQVLVKMSVKIYLCR